MNDRVVKVTYSESGPFTIPVRRNTGTVDKRSQTPPLRFRHDGGKLTPVQDEASPAPLSDPSGDVSSASDRR
jgi:hypothetical protein